MAITLIFISPPDVPASATAYAAEHSTKSAGIVVVIDNRLADEAIPFTNPPLIQNIERLKITAGKTDLRGNYHKTFGLPDNLFAPPRDEFKPHFIPSESVLNVRKQTEIVRMM